MANTATLAFEIGSEEIPAFDLAAATKQLEGIIRGALEAAHLSYARSNIFSSPRRLIVIVEDLALETQAQIEEYKGPKVSIAFDGEGNPTKAALGFARGKGLEVGQLERRVQGGDEYLFAIKQIDAQPALEILPEILNDVITSISWPKSMKWNTKTAYFSRPVRWLLALLGTEIIPVSFAGITSSNFTWGHRFLAPGEHAVASADRLLDVLERVYVVPSQKAREKVIRDGIGAIEDQTHTHAELPDKTLIEVVNLTEYPTPLVGSFDEEYLQVPEEIIIDALLMHQRYFPLYDLSGKLTNKFIAVSNGNPKFSSVIIEGNERVVRPRLADAKFFYEEDLKYPLEYYVDRLDEVVFQETLGTMKAKTERIVILADELAADAGIDSLEAEYVHRAAYLCKADLVTNAVIEFTSVQGIMGSYYALAAGEPAHVAEAIAEHYRPRFAQDELPSSRVGCLVACADKLDTICGLFSINQAPTGSSDPFALRRSAIGIISMLDEGLPISLSKAVRSSLDTVCNVKFDAKAVAQEVIEFFLIRTKVILRDRGHSSDVIDAVLASGISEPAELIARTEALSQAREDMREVMEDLATAYARANNLREMNLGIEVDTKLMAEPEQVLYQAIIDAEIQVEQSLAQDNYAKALRDLAMLRAPIDRFFEEVMVMDKDIKLKENRLKLLNRFVSAFTHIADFGKMAKQGK